MAHADFIPEERIGLVLAIALHGGVLALLMLNPVSKPRPTPPRLEVTLSDNVGLADSTPRSREQAAADIAPRLGTAQPPSPPAPPAPVKAQPSQLPLHKPHPAPPPPKPLPAKPIPAKPAPRPSPLPSRPVATPHLVSRHHPAPARPDIAPPDNPARPAKPSAKPTPTRPTPLPSPSLARPAAMPRTTPSPHLLARPHAPQPDVSPAEHPSHTAKTTGGSRIGADFLKGLTSANTTGKAKAPLSQTAGPAVQAAIAGVLARQLKAHWIAPQGADADRLVTILTFDLNRDGTLNGPPRVVRQDGVDDSNRPQAARHAEQAIRAVELAEPFQLPPEYYDTWKHITSSRFDWKLSQ